jgi:uncharacterized SAM-binding protein YcdF (DUF218 family)
MFTVRLYSRKTMYLPTIWGWLIIAAVAGGSALLILDNLDRFLSSGHPVEAQVLIVEGWLPDYGLVAAKAEYQSKPYRLLVTTGVPIETGTFLSEYGTFAQRGKRSLVRLGVPDSLVVAVPAESVERDRTYASALALKRYLDKRGISGGGANLVSQGVHTRRSAFLFQKALGATWRVGSIAVTDRSYNASRWWMSSEGFRAVVGETIAWIYAVIAVR